MTKIKLVAADIDGTLVDETGIISERNKKAIGLLEEKGIEFILCSGRSPRELREFLKENNFKANALGCNGALTMDKRDRVSDVLAIDKSVILKCDKLAKEVGCIYIFHGAKDTYTGLSKEDVIRIFADFRLNVDSNRPAEEINWVLKAMCFSEKTEDILKDDICKFEFVYISKEKEDFIKERLKNEDVFFTTSGFSNVELMHKDSGKGRNLLNYCLKKGIKKDEIMYFGDNENDRDALELFENSVIMGNAPDSIKALNRYIAPGVKEDGVAKVIEDYISKL